MVNPLPAGALPKNPEPYKRLAERIRELLDDGLSVPCSGSALPVSESVVDRLKAVETLCAGCPALEACAVAGDAESFGVWGGVDRTPAPGAARRSRQAAA